MPVMEVKVVTDGDGCEVQSIGQVDDAGCKLGIRHLQVVMLFLCIATNYLMRVNLSIGIVLMNDSSATSLAPVFNWTMAQRSSVQSSFFIGYFLMNLSSAVLVSYWGSKKLLLVNVGVSSILTAVTPLLVVACGYYMLLTIRVFLGLVQGLMMAAIMTLLSKWIPPSERGRCGALVLCGSHFGTIMAFALGGWLGVALGGWPSVFYFPGALGLLWTLAWCAVGAESPADCRLMSTHERNFIEERLKRNQGCKTEKKDKIPWKRMLRNRACWALVLVSLADSWGFSTIVTEMPTYFESVLHLANITNGLISAVPYACLWLVSMLSSYAADILIKKGVTSITFSRKMANTIGHCGPAIALVVLVYTKEYTSIILMFTICITLSGFVFIGYNINHLDIVPDHAGFLMGITNGVSNIASFLAPLFAGFIVSESDNEHQWAIVFWVAAGIYFIGNAIFVTFGSGEVQKDITNEGSDDYSHQGTTLAEEFGYC